MTLYDNRVYSIEQDEVSFSDIMISLSVMQRAHEESLSKSKRLSEAWKTKRKEAQVKKLTAKCPGWLKLNKNTNEFEIIQERADIVRRIFNMTLDNVGKIAITQQFKVERVPTFGRSKGWQASYIQKILTNEAVIGAFQPHRIKETPNGNRKRIPEGALIEGYYPQIVNREVFLKVQRIRKQRCIPSGKTGNSYSNLFRGLAYCGSCGATMVFENKGRGPKGGQYLVCSAARRKVGNCKRHSWRYPQTQAHIISNLLETDFSALFPELQSKSNERVSELEGELLITKAQAEKINIQLENIINLLVDRADSPALLKKLDALEKEKTLIETQLEKLNDNLTAEHDRFSSAGHDLAAVETAFNRFLDIEIRGDDTQKTDVRRKLYQNLNRVIERIVLYPHNAENSEELHGTIEILFQSVSKYKRLIRVDKRQDSSKGYKVTDNQETLNVVINNAKWPPAGRILFGKALEHFLF
ncbi:MAG: hypothetical protein GY874_18115 [Desulfobacteraceae bacterium]|nr:hypothetical protein [Desulfobacteraceae bacterium]